MAIHEALKKHAQEPGIRAYSRALRAIEKDLGKANSTVLGVELLAKQDQRSALRKFFALEKATDADHWLSVTAVVEGRDVRIQAPFRRGLHLPYSVEITLNCRPPVQASLRRNMVLRPKWTIQPDTLENRPKAAGLEALKLPDVGWRHDSGGIPIFLDEGGRISPQPGKGRKTSWTIFSAYQGFLINVGPRVAKYVQAAARLEALLLKWSQEELTAPAPAERKPVVRKPAPEPEPAPAQPAVKGSDFAAALAAAPEAPPAEPKPPSSLLSDAEMQAFLGAEGEKK